MTRGATATGDDRINHNSVANLETVYILANFLDDSTKFMPQDGRILDPAVKLAAVDVQIGATDTRVTGCHQHFIRLDLRIGSVTEQDISIVVDDACFHFTTSML